MNCWQPSNPVKIAVAAVISAAALVFSIDAPALAERREVDLRLPVRDGESYAVLVRKAESMARTAAQKAFDREVLVSDVSVKVTAQKQDYAALVLQLTVSRSNWLQRPDPRVWARYFPMTQQLVGIE